MLTRLVLLSCSSWLIAVALCWLNGGIFCRKSSAKPDKKPNPRTRKSVSRLGASQLYDANQNCAPDVLRIIKAALAVARIEAILVDMTNGETHHCAEYCRHFESSINTCRLRNAKIESPFWTTCKNLDGPARIIIGPLHAIICEVKNDKGAYSDIPYFDGCRVDTVQRDGRGDTVVCLTDRNGKSHEFGSLTEYMEFYLHNSKNVPESPLEISRANEKPMGLQTLESLLAD